MSELHSLESLEALNADLLALSESRLSNVERLGIQLEAHIQDFRALLDKSARNEQSRKSLETGKLDFDGGYSINEEFQHGAKKLADTLDLDELAAARILLEAQEESESTGRSLLTCSIVRFHQRRKVLLDCLRLICELAADVDREELERDGLLHLLDEIVKPQGASNAPNDPSRYVRRCLASMTDIKNWLHKLAEISNTGSVTGQHSDVTETLEYQRVSLVKQHELLGVIIFYVVKQNYTVLADFESVLDTLKRVDKFDNLLFHYFPAVSAYISRFGSQEGGATVEEARALNEKIVNQADQNPWSLTYVHAGFRAWWLAEYSGWYGEHYDGTLPQSQLDEEAKQRSKQFSAALKDGAFDFILSLSAGVKSNEWRDPARHGLRQWLQRKAPFLPSDSTPFSDFFQEVLMEQLELFIEGFITNLPDVLRKLRLDEDEQRQLNSSHDHDLDLERFIVTISYAFEGRPKAALEAFWDVPDGALIGFIQWASRRASTPLVSAFCEMLQAISEDEECGAAAHEFLLDEGSQSSGKMRRTHSLTWNQIFKELSFFASKLRDRPSAPQAYDTGKPSVDHAEMEPESFLMLESYLRLITRLCTASADARTFLTQHPSFHLTELLFQFASSSIEPRLKACVFTTLQALLTHKTKEAGEYLWTALDVWVSGGSSPGSNMPKTAAASASAVSAERILRGLGAGFEEPNAFVQFLHALVSPYDGESGLHDGLSFPENLGASSRMPGIDPYIDFALGQVFGFQTSELNDVVQVRLLQLTCLDFIATCLDTFNEDLVVFANRTSVVVDSAIKASNLQTYVLLHPFSRVMEWMFNEKTMNALFSAVHQNIEDVGSAAPDSPLILCLLRGIHVLTSIMDLQPTYLDIVRPLVKLQSTHRRVAVASAAFASFEDGILNHLSIIPDLGLYCGTGHADLVIASLTLLEKLSASPKLASAPSIGLGRRSDRNKAIAALEANGDTETISRTLLQEIAANIDINRGPDSATYVIKIKILDFLISCLKASPGQPTIAHLLLGFECNDNVLDVDINSPFNHGISLFHAILGMVLDIPLIDETATVSSWLVTLKYKGLQVLHQLWHSPLSSALTMVELRASQSLFIMFSKRDLIQQELFWDGRSLADQDFLLSPAASCLSEFLSQRALTLQYVAAELRQVSNTHAPSLKKRIFSTLLGSTTAEDGEQVENPSVFDLFEFVELEFNQPGTLPTLQWFPDMNLEVCLTTDHDSPAVYDISKVRELLLLRRAELEKENRLGNPQDAALVDAQTEDLIKFCVIDNQVTIFWASRLTLLRSWVQLVQLMIETGEFEGSDKTSFILRTLRTILGSLENRLENIGESMELARLTKSLIFSLDFDSESFKQGDMGDLVSGRLFHLFQVSLRAINSLGANPPLKEIFYTISYRYLTGMSDVSGISGIHRRHSTQTIKAVGERFIDIVCDDAYSGEPMCRISALLLLSALAKMAEHDNSKYILESLSRLNFIGILIDSIRNIPGDLRDTRREDVGLQLSYFHARLALLLHIAQSRLGATAVLTAGLFHAIKLSGLFTIDPDLGVDIDDPDAVRKFYELLVAVSRVICAVVLSRGQQNEQTLEQGRRFLSDNRLSVLATLKKSAGLGTGTRSAMPAIEELVDSYTLLMSVTGFVDFEEETSQARPLPKAFT